MASVEERNGRFRVCFRFGGVKYNRTLKTRSEAEAAGRCRRLEENIRLVESGRLSIPMGADIAALAALFLGAGFGSEKAKETAG